MSWVRMLCFASYGAVVASWFAGCACDDASRPPVDIRELVTVEFETARAPAEIAAGTGWTLELSGTLPGECYRFERALLVRGDGGLAVQAFATRAFGGCAAGGGETFSQQLTIAGFGAGIQLVTVPGVGVLNVAVRELRDAKACEPATFEISDATLPAVLAGGVPVTGRATVRFENVCSALEAIEADDTGENITLTARGYDCTAIVDNCPADAWTTTGSFTFTPRQWGGDLTLVTGASVLQPLEVMPAGECDRNPADVALITVPDEIFAGRPFTIGLTGIVARDGYLSALSKFTISNAIDYALDAVLCSPGLVDASVIRAFTVEDSITPAAPGTLRLSANGGADATALVLPACEPGEAGIERVEVTTDLITPIDKGVAAGMPVNLTADVRVERACQREAPPAVTIEPDRLQLVVPLEACAALPCEAATRTFQSTLAVVGLGAGDYAVEINGTAAVKFSVKE